MNDTAISAVSGPKFTILRGHVETLLFNKFPPFLQHVRRDAARRAGLPATADPCFRNVVHSFHVLTGCGLASGNVAGYIDEVTLHRARLVLRW